MEKVKEKVKIHHSIELRFALDQIYISPLNLINSIQQELHILNYAQMEEKSTNCLWSNEILIDREGFYFPKDLEQRLINFTKDGNSGGVLETLKELKISNLIRRQLPPNMLRMLIYQLYGTLIQISQELSVDNEDIYGFADRLSTQGDLSSFYSEAFEFIDKFFLYLCQIVNERKENQSTRLMIEVRDYIKDNFFDRDLSLLTLAERFNYSPAYLSLFFKEQLGKNFSTYLEEIRMEEAMKLLIKSNTSIGEIANKVGYNSTNSFCRAFKRKFELSPGQYRQINAN